MTPEQFMENFGVIAEAPGGIEKLRELVVELAVGGQLAASGRWPRRLLFDVATDLRNGIAKRGGEGIPTVVLRLADLRGTSTATDNLRKIPLTDDEQEKYRLFATDLLAIRVNGSKHLVGRMVRCDKAVGFAYSDHLIRVRLCASLIPEFLILVSLSSGGKSYLDSQTKTTAGQHTINQQGLGGLPVPVPPLAEQKRIVAKVDQLMAMLDDLEQLQNKKRNVAMRLALATSAL